MSGNYSAENSAHAPLDLPAENHRVRPFLQENSRVTDLRYHRFRRDTSPFQKHSHPFRCTDFALCAFWDLHLCDLFFPFLWGKTNVPQQIGRTGRPLMKKVKDSLLKILRGISGISVHIQEFLFELAPQFLNRIEQRRIGWQKHQANGQVPASVAFHRQRTRFGRPRFGMHERERAFLGFQANQDVGMKVQRAVILDHPDPLHSRIGFINLTIKLDQTVAIRLSLMRTRQDRAGMSIEHASEAGEFMAPIRSACSGSPLGA